jgi:hypothetical protein
MGKILPCNHERGSKIFGTVAELSLIVALLACSAGTAVAAAPPDFGPNVLIFDPSTPAAAIQEQIIKIYATQQNSQFGPARNALLFAPGAYKVDIPVGFYTQVLGLGASPDNVHITGNVHSDAYRVRDINVEGNNQQAGLRHVRVYGLRTAG